MEKKNISIPWGAVLEALFPGGLDRRLGNQTSNHCKPEQARESDGLKERCGLGAPSCVTRVATVLPRLEPGS